MIARSLRAILGLLVGISGLVVLGASPAAGDELLPWIEVDSSQYREAVTLIAAAEQQLVDSAQVIGFTTRQLEELNLAESQLARSIPGIEKRRDAVAVELELVRAEITVLAREFYVLGDIGSARVIATLLDTQAGLRQRERLELFETLEAGRQQEATRLKNSLTDSNFALDAARDGLTVLRGRIVFNEQQQSEAVALEASATEALPGLRSERDLSRRVATVRGTDLQLVALDAYLQAASGSSPGCNLNWSLLAGIGRVESRHGRFGGRSVAAYGAVSPPIIGIPLDGTNNTREILDSDGGAYDGDAVYDRAVGPMQFIPTTWAVFAADGNGDGVADPQNIYDSAASAAKYLCRAGDLSDAGNRQRAVLSYNRSDSYVASVLSNMASYAALGLG